MPLSTLFGDFGHLCLILGLLFQLLLLLVGQGLLDCLLLSLFALLTSTLITVGITILLILDNRDDQKCMFCLNCVQ